jgi:ABC-type lipoprotein release transport system permease subunit
MLPKFHLLLLFLYNYKKKHIAVFLLSSLLIGILASVLFLSSSIQKDLESSLEQQADFTIQRFEAGHLLNAPKKWIEEYLQIPGVTQVQGRIYGSHYYEPKEQYFMVVGADFYDEQIVKGMQTFIDNLDVEKFLARKNMIVGAGVKEFLDEYHYTKYYIFRPPDRSKEKVYIYNEFVKESRILTNDMVLMDISQARKILGVKDGFVTDIVLNISNQDEYQKIYEKLIISHFNTRIITKKDIAKHYTKLFNYKGGIFVVLYIIAIVSFLLILYQRYSMVQTVDVKEIAILRSVGWRVDEIITFKIAENFIVALFSYLSGVMIAYIYVFFLGAPLLRNIFLGDENLVNHPLFYPSINPLDLVLLFGAFILPFLLSIIIPVWRLSVREMSEVMR